jgi:hypothetical protein
MSNKQKLKRVQRRWDKVLAKHYGITKMWRQYAKSHGSSIELMLSNLVQQGVVTFKPLPEDKEHAIYWRQAR